MKLLFKKHKTKAFAKEKRFNPHHFWVWYIGFFIVIVIVELVFFVSYFLRVTDKLDSPVTPTLINNTHKIKSMQKTLDDIDTAIKARTGNTSEVVPTAPTTPTKNTTPVAQ